MNTFFNKMKWAVCLAGTLALTVPAVAGAATDSSERWHEGQADLQKNLPPGQLVDVYRKKLDELGYKVTSTNYNNPDYVEYEIVRGDQTWEVQIVQGSRFRKESVCHRQEQRSPPGARWRAGQ